MQTRNPFLDDIARVLSGAAGAAGGMREEVEARIRSQFERILADMNLVTAEDFEAVQAMASRARLEQEALQERLDELEARVRELTNRQISASKENSSASASPEDTAGAKEVTAAEDAAGEDAPE